MEVVFVFVSEKNHGDGMTVKKSCAAHPARDVS
jgi:hypothetical protein